MDPQEWRCMFGTLTVSVVLVFFFINEPQESARKRNTSSTDEKPGHGSTHRHIGKWLSSRPFTSTRWAKSASTLADLPSRSSSSNQAATAGAKVNSPMRSKGKQMRVPGAPRCCWSPSHPFAAASRFPCNNSHYRVEQRADTRGGSSL